MSFTSQKHISICFEVNEKRLQMKRFESRWVVVLVPQVVDIMRVNVDKVLERDQKLSELDDRADALQAGASQFESSAAKLKNKYWWKNCKVGALGGCRCWLFVPCSWKIKTLSHRKRKVCGETHCCSKVGCSEYVYVVCK